MRRRSFASIVLAETLALVAVMAMFSCTATNTAPSGGLFGDRPRDDDGGVVSDDGGAGAADANASPDVRDAGLETGDTGGGG